MTFNNPVVGGTTLIRAAIQSPNFVTGVSGWSIDKDGDAEFNSLDVRGTFSGNDFEINSAGIFFYSGTPAAGNLISSYTNSAGTDGSGNAYLLGTTSYQNNTSYFIATNSNAVSGSTYWTSTTEAGPWTQIAQIIPDNLGDLTVQANGSISLNPGGSSSISTLILPAPPSLPAWEDNSGTDWQLGSQSAFLTSEFDVVSGTQAAITGLQLHLVAGIYFVRLKLYGTNSSVSGVTYTPGFTFGGSTFQILFNQVNWLTAGQSTTALQSNIINVTSLTGFNPSPASTGTSRVCWTEIDGFLGVTSGANLKATCLTSTAGDAFHIMPGSFLSAVPVA
jgi:hypothetical protein